MLLPHAQREANPPCPQFFQALPTAQGHWNGASRLCKGYRDHKTAQQRNCRWSNSSQHDKEPSQNRSPQNLNRQIVLAVLARRVSRGHARWKEASHASEGGFVKALCKALGLPW